MPPYSGQIEAGANGTWEFQVDSPAIVTVDGGAQPYDLDIETKQRDDPDSAYDRISPLDEFGVLTVSTTAEKVFETDEVDEAVRITITNNSGEDATFSGSVRSGGATAYLREDKTIYHFPESRLNNLSGAITGNQQLSGIGQPQNGLVYADDGNFYTTVQAAVDAASAYVSIGAATYEENVTITTDGLQLECISEQSVIDGASSGPAVSVEAADVNLRGFQARTDAASSEHAITATAAADRLDIEGVDVSEAGADGISTPSGANEIEVRECRIESCDNRAADLAGDECRLEAVYALSEADDGLRTQGIRSAIVHCYSLNHSNEGIESEGDESRVIGNTVDNVADNGILLQGDDSVCNNNVVTRSGGDGIRVQGTDDIITGNRIGGSTDADLNTSGATTPTTGNNNTGSLK